MGQTNNKNNKRAWIVGGTTLVGIGVGFIFLQQSAQFFVASILIGIGVGLLIVSLISIEKK
jgi:cyanate permease